MNKGALTDFIKESLLRSNQRKLSPKQHLSVYDNPSTRVTILHNASHEILSSLHYTYFNLSRYKGLNIDIKLCAVINGNTKILFQFNVKEDYNS